MLCSTLVLVAAPLGSPPAVPPAGPAALPSAQDPVELDRLATDQRQVAEQVRRLVRLLGVLEERDRESGRDKRADLLRQAIERLEAARGSQDLAAALDAVASDLGQMRTGDALAAQQEVIQLLQDVLDQLLETERRERELLRQEMLEERLESLREFAERQRDLRERNEALQERMREAAERGDEMSEEERQELAEEMERLAEEQRELAQELEQFNREQEREERLRSRPSEEAQERMDEAAEEMRPPDAESAPQSQEPQAQQQRMESAEQQQREAEEKLRDAEEETQDELDRQQTERERETLLNVLEEAEALLERHREVEAEIAALAEEHAAARRIPREARSRMRQLAAEERALAELTSTLLNTIAEHGADSFPFFMRTLREDHERLAKEIGPPRYRLDGMATRVAADLSEGWAQLIDAIRVELERLRKRLEGESPGGGQGGNGEPQDREDPLVNFAMELQLLKRMQASLNEQLVLVRDRIRAFREAGIGVGPEELAELQMLIERQREFQYQYESMVRRAQGGDDSADTGEDV